ncbi:metal ABC transporter solute-binding protein, Zn/Mn family [Corynebacterium minutissimum]|uniref:ABC transporter, solute-binding protein n=1 Tax=Corynebacterium minutissimum TaxID=38301 RepID=A0A2X4R9P6_9CORY|nr:zinc ABC transporter substrate-binding protein [Corynebacterium minutissimum]KHO28695.1 ABC transporter substrate-binding protein [Corynebacterium minutissimum]MCG7229803.1 zinc ABC transporter substrate-binding protein [Corynebacterium minutissimum]MCG7238874.1 zinc ABC transporter substrate-binding protein [Corynebacterium minutissimum]QPS59661.1 zinc ABC transporter substrate-binding protein [Corynebacterium minutissimum]QQA79549.1 zinc ABC transporter substrate-binding protein [Coryneba
MTTSLSRQSWRRPTALLFAATLGAASLTACSSSGDNSDGGARTGSDKETIHVVASTSIWADVAQAVVDTAETDVNIDVKAIVTGNDVDPHHFEPTAADIARANEADVIIAGGGGYDAWLYQAVKNQDAIIHALPLTEHSHDHAHDEHDHAHDGRAHEDGHEHGDHTHKHAHDEGHDHEHAHEDGHEHAHDVETVSMDEAKKIAAEHPETITNIEGNEHVWYDAAAIEKVANEVATLVNKTNPEAKATADPLVQRVEKIKERVGKLPAQNYAQTEPIADYIMKYSDSTDVTPEGYRKATVAEGEPSAADLARFLEAINQGKVDLLIFNPQTETDMTKRIRSAAEDKNIPVVEIGETPPENTNFLDYYEEAVSALEAA